MKTATEKLQQCHAPINKTAALGIKSGPERRDWTTKTCPPLNKEPFKELRKRIGSKLEDLTGMRRGMMVIIGLAEAGWSGNKSRWVAKCECGNYEYRRYDRWLTAARKGWGDCCEQCLPLSRGNKSEASNAGIEAP